MYFRGTGPYHTTFAWTPGKFQIPNLKSQISLDLGKVQVMAHVKLNGKDLGILWKPPFRVDIAEAVAPGGNALEVRVANLWPNRLIGDQSLPQDQRVTWTTWNPFKKDSPLLESGLLGPVRLFTADPVMIQSR